MHFIMSLSPNIKWKMNYLGVSHYILVYKKISMYLLNLKQNYEKELGVFFWLEFKAAWHTHCIKA